MPESDAQQRAMAELYREEVLTHGGALASGLLQMEKLFATPASGSAVAPVVASSGGDSVAALYASLLRAAHSLKGAARIVSFGPVADVVHALESVFARAQRLGVALVPAQVDVLLGAVDYLKTSATPVGAAATQSWLAGAMVPGQEWVRALRLIESALVAAPAQGGEGIPPQPSALFTVSQQATQRDAETAMLRDGRADAASVGSGSPAAVVRVSAQRLDELLRLGAQGRLLRRRLDQLPSALLKLSAQQLSLEQAIDACSAQLARQGLEGEERRALLAPLREEASRLRRLQQGLREQTASCVQEQALLSERWYAQVVACRMRPFADIVSGFPRLVRDLGRSLGKSIVLSIEGAATLADRDILERLEAPLVHLLRNACSHGLETEAERLAAGKPVEGQLTLHASHSDGWLVVSVSDDGRGIDADALRRRLLASGQIADPLLAQALCAEEVFEYLFESGFSTASQVDAVAGRGIGLDAVRSQVRELGGQVSLQTQLGEGTVFTLRVPVTRALLRALCVRIDGEPYALPLGQIERLISVSRQEARAGVIDLDGQQTQILSLMCELGLDAQTAGSSADGGAGGSGVTLAAGSPDLGAAALSGSSAASDLSGLQAVSSAAVALASATLRMVVVQLRGRRWVLDAGVVEDELELVVQATDKRFGSLPLLQAAGLNEQGEVVLIVDLEALAEQVGARTLAASGQDWLSQEKWGASSASDGDASAASATAALPRLRVLLADDSALARAQVGAILEAAGGFELTAVTDGQEAWELLEPDTGRFDLLVTDLEMPRLDGCELVCRLRGRQAGAMPMGGAALSTAAGKGDEARARLPIVILSAQDGESFCKCGLDSGADRYLSKTLLQDDPQAFVQILRALALGARS